MHGLLSVQSLLAMSELTHGAQSSLAIYSYRADLQCKELRLIRKPLVPTVFDCFQYVNMEGGSLGLE